MVKIVVNSFGNVHEGFSGEIRGILNECYNRCQPHPVQIVDLYLFQRSSTMNAVLNDEKGRLGIATSPFDASFLATHDAWRGTPRIMVAVDRVMDVAKVIRVGAVRHEAAHTILHGSLKYYLFPVPTGLMKLGTRNAWPRQFMIDLLYLISIAVKDYEVTRLLYKKGYVEDQVAYSKYLLEPTDEEPQAWNLARADRRARILVLVSILKTACGATALIEDERYGREVVNAIDRCTSYLPDALSNWLMRVLKATTNFSSDTHRNVEMFTNKIMLELDKVHQQDF